MLSTNKQSMPKWILWTILILISAILAFTSAEVLLRFIPGPWTNGFFYVHDSLVGTWHLSNFTADKVEADYDIRGIHFNEFGMRDKERKLIKEEGVTRIAVLGDSFVEGVQVSNEDVLTKKMEDYLGEKVEVLNFGVAGFGTLQAYLTYKERVQKFKPDIVVLGFLSANDIRNNSLELESLYEGGKHPDKPFLERTKEGWEILPVPQKSSAQNGAVLYLKKHFVLYRFLWFAKGRMVGMFRTAPVVEDRGSENINAYLERLFMFPEEEVFEKAWGATDYLIEELKKEVEKDGARFILVSFPTGIHMEEDPKKTLEEEYGASLPEEYDVDYPEIHLSNFSREKGILYLDMTPVFRAYRDEYKLSSPYFSYDHDGHWAPIGHDLAAKTIAEYLRAYKLMK